MMGGRGRYKEVERQIEVFTKDLLVLYICADAVTEHRILFYIFHFKICTFVRMWNMHTQSILLLECVLINEKCYQASIIESLCVHWGNDVDDDNFFLLYSWMYMQNIFVLLSLATNFFVLWILQRILIFLGWFLVGIWWDLCLTDSL